MRRRAVVTGASSGIGAASVQTLVEQGCDVWLTYATAADGALQVTRNLGDDAAFRVSHLDLRDPSSVASFVEEVSETWSALDVLVNNGGVCPYHALEEIGVDEWDAVFETNARGTFLLTRGLLPLLREAAIANGDCSVVNVSSIAGQVGSIKTGIHYAASKGAILAMTRSFARLLAPDGVRVNAVTPGPICTRITENLSDGARADLARSVPLGRFGDAAEVAAVIGALASPMSSFVTGATWDVNGGVHIG